MHSAPRVELIPTGHNLSLFTQSLRHSSMRLAASVCILLACRASTRQSEWPWPRPQVRDWPWAKSPESDDRDSAKAPDLDASPAPPPSVDAGAGASEQFVSIGADGGQEPHVISAVGVGGDSNASGVVFKSVRVNATEDGGVVNVIETTIALGSVSSETETFSATKRQAGESLFDEAGATSPSPVAGQPASWATIDEDGGPSTHAINAAGIGLDTNASGIVLESIQLNLTEDGGGGSMNVTQTTVTSHGNVTTESHIFDLTKQEPADGAAPVVAAEGAGQQQQQPHQQQPEEASVAASGQSEDEQPPPPPEPAQEAAPEAPSEEAPVEEPSAAPSPPPPPPPPHMIDAVGVGLNTSASGVVLESVHVNLTAAAEGDGVSGSTSGTLNLTETTVSLGNVTTQTETFTMTKHPEAAAAEGAPVQELNEPADPGEDGAEGRQQAGEAPTSVAEEVAASTPAADLEGGGAPSDISIDTDASDSGGLQTQTAHTVDAVGVGLNRTASGVVFESVHVNVTGPDSGVVNITETTVSAGNFTTQTETFVLSKQQEATAEPTSAGEEEGGGGGAEADATVLSQGGESVAASDETGARTVSTAEAAQPVVVEPAAEAPSSTGQAFIATKVTEEETVVVMEGPAGTAAEPTVVVMQEEETIVHKQQAAVASAEEPIAPTAAAEEAAEPSAEAPPALETAPAAEPPDSFTAALSHDGQQLRPTEPTDFMTAAAAGSGGEEVPAGTTAAISDEELIRLATAPPPVPVTSDFVPPDLPPPIRTEPVEVPAPQPTPEQLQAMQAVEAAALPTLSEPTLEQEAITAAATLPAQHMMISPTEVQRIAAEAGLPPDTTADILRVLQGIKAGEQEADAAAPVAAAPVAPSAEAVVAEATTGTDVTPPPTSSAPADIITPTGSHGVVDWAQPDHFSLQMSLPAAQSLLAQPGHLWGAVEADAYQRGLKPGSYYANVLYGAREFIQSSVLHDREETMSVLASLLGDQKGQMALLLGAHNIGKSLMIETLARQLEGGFSWRLESEARTNVTDAVKQAEKDYKKELKKERKHRRWRPWQWSKPSLTPPPPAIPQRTRALLSQVAVVGGTGRRNAVAVIDAKRSHGDFVNELLLQMSPIPGFLDVLKASLAHNTPSIEAMGHLFPKNWNVGHAIAAVAAIWPRALSYHGLDAIIQSFIKAANVQGRYPILLLDDSDDGLPTDDPKGRQQTLDTLELLSLYSKQNLQMNVLLVSSNTQEPSRLTAAGFYTGHFTETVIAGEVSPSAMLSLLQDSWGAGTQLAHGLMAVYGGNIWMTCNALEKLGRSRQAFAGLQGIPLAEVQGVAHVMGQCSSAQSSSFSSSSSSSSPPLSSTDSGDGAMCEGVKALLTSLAVRGYALIGDPGDAAVQQLVVNNVAAALPLSASTPASVCPHHARLEAAATAASSGSHEHGGGGGGSAFLLVPALQCTRALIAHALL